MMELVSWDDDIPIYYGEKKNMFQTTNQIENQWPFQEPKLEVPTICFGPICQGYFSGDIPSKYGQKYGKYCGWLLIIPLFCWDFNHPVGGAGFRNHPPYHLNNEYYVVVYSFKSVLNMIYVISHIWYHGKYDIGSY